MAVCTIPTRRPHPTKTYTYPILPVTSHIARAIREECTGSYSRVHACMQSHFAQRAPSPPGQVTQPQQPPRHAPCRAQRGPAAYSVLPLSHSSAATGGLAMVVPVPNFCRSSLQDVAVCHVHGPHRHSSAHVRSLNFDDLAVVLYAGHEEASIVLCTPPFAILCCSGRVARVDRRPLPLLAPPCNLHRIGICPAFTPKPQSTCLNGSGCFGRIAASCALTHGERDSRVRCSVRRLRHRCSRPLLDRSSRDSSMRRRHRRRSGSTHFSGTAAQLNAFPACTPALGGRAQSHVTIPNINEYAGVFSER